MGKFLLENATNLGKMNHSHFIWTSVLTPPLPSPPPDFHSFVTVLLQLVQVAGGSGAKKNAAWRWSKMLRSCRVCNGVSSVHYMAVITLRTVSPEKAYWTKQARFFFFCPAAECLPLCRSSLSKDV